MDEASATNWGCVLLPACFFGLYFVMEAADWGICLAAPFVTRSAEERKAVLRLMKPFLDGNELWFFIGMFMMASAMPAMQAEGQMPWYTVPVAAVGFGALLRAAAVFWADHLATRVFMRILCGCSVISLCILSFVSTALIQNGTGTITLLGVTSAFCLVTACFQIGTLYCAVKAVNPLGERCRAASLVSSCLAVVFYLIFAVTLHLTFRNIWAAAYFWMCLAATALLFSASFALTRSRKPGAGLAAGYASAFFAIVIYFSAFVALVPHMYPLDNQALKEGLSHVPSAAILALAALWTAVSMIWRLARKKEAYDWQDHI